MVQSFGEIAERSWTCGSGSLSERTRFRASGRAWHAIRPVSARTNSTDQKAPAFFISAPVCRSIASNSADHTKASAGREPRTFRRSSGWRRPRRKRCGIRLRNRNARPACANSCGAASNAFSPQAQLNAGRAPRLANTLNVSFPGFASETILMALDLEGSAPRAARLAWSAPWSPPMSCSRWACRRSAPLPPFASR